MVKIGIIRCQEHSNSCAGFNCFPAFRDKTGEFERYDTMEIVGFDTCGGCGRGKADKILARALDVLFILHIDHEQNCSANAMRAVGSSQADPFVSTAAAAAALSGPLHGGANEQVLKMLDEIGSVDNVPAYAGVAAVDC